VRARVRLRVVRGTKRVVLDQQAQVMVCLSVLASPCVFLL